MNEPNKEDLVQKLRASMPAHPVTLGEAYSLAERQSLELLMYWGVKSTPIPTEVCRIVDLPQLDTNVVPRHWLPRAAGLCRVLRDERGQILVNKGDTQGRRRFTLAHEFKHYLDDPIAEAVYAELGYGDERLRARQIEQICDMFAACLLMPRMVVKRLWTSGIQDAESLALLFDVSLSAMTIRLKYLGLDHDDRPVKAYFRSQLRSGVKLPPHSTKAPGPKQLITNNR